MPLNIEQNNNRPHLLFLFIDHLVQYRHEPVFKLAVVVIWCQQVANAVDASVTKVAARQVKIGDVRRCQTFDEVFFNATGCCDYAVNLDTHTSL